MKHLFLIISLGFFSILNAKVECTSDYIELTLDSSSSELTACQELNIEQKYRLQLCSDDRGALIEEDGSYEFLFKTENVWKARTDISDFTNNLMITQIFLLNENLSEFSVTKIIKKYNPEDTTTVECHGYANLLN